MELRIIVVAIVLTCAHVAHSARLWCHQGGAKRDWGPTQCPESTKECFKFDCIGGQSPFVARGCGVLTMSRGLQNESCFQAMEVCQHIGGQSVCNTCNNRQMCNSAPTSLPSPIFPLLLLLPPAFIGRIGLLR